MRTGWGGRHLFLHGLATCLDSTTNKGRRRLRMNRGSAIPKPLVPAVLPPQWNLDTRGRDVTMTTTHYLSQSQPNFATSCTLHYICGLFVVGHFIAKDKETKRHLLSFVIHLHYHSLLSIFTQHLNRPPFFVFFFQVSRQCQESLFIYASMEKFYYLCKLKGIFFS